ncbi:MAG: metal-dependent hydrolase [Leptospiraceae bacterium]|nr:metal-dependent hydrolase [Leptospiraceae bacterium]MCP5512198.1 metal-dependent hydrolase [Leptospiraceae bacterium]
MQNETTITVRKPDFKYHKDIPVHWMNNNSFSTHLLNSFHLVFPPGEKFFIRSINAFKDKITSEDLKEDIKRFVGQEMQHSKEHEKFWEIMETQGYEIHNFLKYQDDFFYNFLENFVKKFLGEKYCLSVTAACEHYTVAFAESVYTQDVFIEVPEELKNLLLWHAAEELEHKSVAYDVLQSVDDSYSVRISGMILASVLLFLASSSGQIYFMAQDKTLSLPKAIGDFWGFITRPSNPLAVALGVVSDYFRPDFHPKDRDNVHLADSFLNRMRYEDREVA